jgi:hypothetical protein
VSRTRGIEVLKKTPLMVRDRAIELRLRADEAEKMYTSPLLVAAMKRVAIAYREAADVLLRHAHGIEDAIKVEVQDPQLSIGEKIDG